MRRWQRCRTTIRQTCRPAILSLGTAPPGGAFCGWRAIAQTVNDNAGESGWQISAEATKGTQENIRRLDRGELDFAMAQRSDFLFRSARRRRLGESLHRPFGDDAGAEYRAVYRTEVQYQFDIDLRGKRVVVGPAGAGFEYFIRPILVAHGLTYMTISRR